MLLLVHGLGGGKMKQALLALEVKSRRAEGRVGLGMRHSLKRVSDTTLKG